ncbi:NAD-binding protein [Sparassis latifolia]
MSAEFNPRVAIVTGAGQGIGRAIALRLADDGLDIAVNDIASNSVKLDEVVGEIQAKGRRAIPLIADVSVEAEVKTMVEKAVEELGGFDVMIANAGVGGGAKPLTEMSTETWDMVMSVNLRGTMLCYKFAAQHMIKQGRGGRIIGASSVLGKKGVAKTSAYSTTKFAIRGLTQCLAQELQPYNITVNAYAPGLILTQLSTFAFSRNGPEATPEVVASVVSYLIKPEAHFITGQSLSVNGGIYME